MGLDAFGPLFALNLRCSPSGVYLFASSAVDSTMVVTSVIICLSCSSFASSSSSGAFGLSSFWFTILGLVAVTGGTVTAGVDGLAAMAFGAATIGGAVK